MQPCSKTPILLALGSALTLAACSGGKPEEKQSPSGAQANAAAVPDNAASANVVASPPGPQALTAKKGALEFSYKWPAEASAIPALNNWLRGNGEKLLADNRSGAVEAQADAKKNGYTLPGYSYEEDYKTVANTPRVLVLLSDGYVFTGGAHGMPINTAIIWDKAAQKRLGTGALVDLPRFTALAKKRFCDALDKQRAEKRGEPVRHDDPNELSDFVECVDMSKQLILPISKGGKGLDVMQIVIDPYEAGPYAEGTYVIDLPLDAGLLATIKPAYRTAFTSGR